MVDQSDYKNQPFMKIKPTGFLLALKYRLKADGLRFIKEPFFFFKKNLKIF